MASVDESVDRLCTLTVELNLLTDQLNDLLRSVEERLRESGIGTEVWIEDKIQLSPEASGQFRLGWAQDKRGNWELRYSLDTFAEDASASVLEASRAVRIAATTRVQKLIEGLAEIVQAGLDELASIRPELEAGPPKEDDSKASNDDAMRKNFVEYGQRLEKMIREVKG